METGDTPYDVRVVVREPAAPADRPPLIFIHGAWHGAWCWEQFLDYFAARGYPCYALDLAGHGESARPRGFNLHTISVHVPPLRRAISEISRRGKPFLVAHSMGGWLAQMLLSEPDPVQVAGAVLVAPIPARGVPLKTVAKILLQHPLKFLRTSFLASFKIDDPAMARKLFHGPEMSEQEVLASTARLRPESGLGCIDMMLGFSRIAPRKVSRVPLVILSPELDYFFPPPNERGLARSLGAEIREFPGMAHNLMEEARWREVADFVGEWIARVERKAA
ncbi:MAG: alpha/beta fold hydrolase [Deltaproteobacteria bacterium]|nr:alpha/beta fold hydrolase [Deltaproteobacteria bacterium]